jgi:serine/threonine protein kinase
VDLWGVGITAIELATMKPPNSDLASVFDIILAIVNGPPPTLPPDKAAPALASFIGAALIKDPAARPDAATLLKHPFLASVDENALAPIVRRGVPAIAPL